MEEQFLEKLRSLERQVFVKYVTVVDKNGYSLASTGEANKSISANIRELQNCATSLFPGATNFKVIVEGPKKSVILGNDGDFLVGVQIDKEAF